MNVLLIEDNPGDAVLARERLERTGLECVLTTAATLGEGLQEGRQNRPDVILLDLGLPDVEGLEGLKRLRQELPEVPLVVLSGSKREGAECVRAGAQDFIPKAEVTPGTLSRSLRFALERKRLNLRLADAAPEVAQRLSQAGLDLDAVSQGLARRSRDADAPALRESSPAMFSALAEGYTELLQAAVHDGSATDVQSVEARYALADRLAYLAAPPTDLMDLHVSAVHSLVPELEPSAALELALKGPELLIQMLGHLASAYRHDSLEHRRRA